MKNFTHISLTAAGPLQSLITKKPEQRTRARVFLLRLRLVLLVVLFISLAGISSAQTEIYYTSFGTSSAFPLGWSNDGIGIWANQVMVPSTGYEGASGSRHARSGNYLDDSGDTGNLKFKLTNVSGYTNLAVIWGAWRSTEFNSGGHKNSPDFKWSKDGITYYSVEFTDIPANSTWGLVNEGAVIPLPAEATGSDIWFKWTIASKYNYYMDDFKVYGTSCTDPATGGTIGESQALCTGEDPDAFSNLTAPGGHSGTLEYKWQVSITGSPFNWEDIPGSNSDTYDAPPLTSTHWFRRLARVDCSADWSRAAASNVTEITVNAIPEAPLAVNHNTIYDGTSKSASATVGPDEVVDWHTDETGATTSGAPTGTNAGIYTAWAETRIPETGCISETRTMVTLTIEKATPTATLAVSNPSVTYNGELQTAVVTVSGSSVTGAVANVINGIKTDAGTYEVKADFVPEDINNYIVLTGLPAGMFTITPRPLNAAFTVDKKCFDGTAQVNMNSIHIVCEVIDGDEINLEYSDAEYANAGPGLDILVTMNGLYLTGNDTENYALTSTWASTTAIIEALPISGTLAKTPDAAGIVESNDVSAVLTGGSGGNGADELQYSTDGGSVWLPYLSGTGITTTGLTEVHIRTRRMSDTCGDSDFNSVKWTVTPALQYLTDNTTMTGSLSYLMVKYPASIPKVIVDEGYKIDFQITLAEALPAGSTISIMQAVNGSPAIPYITNAVVPSQSFRITDLSNPVQEPSDFNSLYDGRTEFYSFSFNSSTGTPLQVDASIKVETIISKDDFAQGSLVVLEEDMFWQYGLPTATISGTKSVCSGSSATIKVDLTGIAPWSITLSDGTVVNEIQTSPYTFTVYPTENATWSVLNVTDGLGDTNSGTGEAKIYYGPVTRAPQIFACPNTAIEVPVTVRSFSEVRDISLTLRYDPAVLTYTGFVSGGVTFNPPDPAIPGSIGEVHDMAYDGSRVIVISKLSETDLQLDDDAVLLTLKFNFISGNSELIWVDSPDESWCSYSYQDIQDGSVDGRKWFCDMPSDTYYMNGLVGAYPDPDVHILFNGTVAGDGDTFTYCYSDNIQVTLQQVEGLPPYEVEWTVNGTRHSATLNNEDALFSGTMAAGTYHFQLSSLTDARGCILTDVAPYSATIVVNEEPDVNILFNGNIAGYEDTFNYCYNENIAVTLGALKGTAPYTIGWTVDGGAEQTAVLDDGGELFNGILPAGTYAIQLTSVTDYKGCVLADISSYSATVIVNPQPDVFFTIDNNPLLPGANKDYCYDVNSINLALVNSQEGQAAVGTAPFNLTFTINGGQPTAVNDIEYDEVFNLVQYLPEGPLGNQVVAGDYVVQVTSLSDANGCSLSGEALSFYSFTLTIHPEPLVSVEPAVTTCIATFTGSVSMVPSVGTRAYIYTLNGVSSGEQTGVYTYSGLAAGTYNWTMTDVVTSCVTSGSVTVEDAAIITLTGTVKYYNIEGTRLDGVNIKLLQEGSTTEVASGITDINGNYVFENICPGTYDVVMTTSKPMRSINSTDAGQVNAWNVAQTDGTWSSIEKVRFLAGDVTGDNHIYALDASIIQNYFLTLGTGVTFDKPWEFWKAGYAVSVQPQIDNVLKVEILPGSTQVIQDFYGLISGDFDRSNVPAASSMGIFGAKNAMTEKSSVTLHRGNELNVIPDEVIELPIRAESSMQVGAISLILDYPNEQIHVEEVFLKNNPAHPAGYNVVNGMLVIGWNSLNSLSVETGEPLVTIKARITGNESDVPVYFSLTSDPLNELADENMIAIDNASLNMDGCIMKGSITGTDVNMKASLLMTISPNPFSDRMTIRYILPSEGHVTLDVTGVSGNRMNILPSQYQMAGEHHLEFDGSGLVTGVYHVTLRVTDKNGQTMTEVRRMIKQ